MPPTGKRLEAHQIDDLKRWVAMGAPWPMSPSEFFRARVQPVLEAKCLGCHGSEPQGGLRLDSHEALLKGGKSGPALVAGDPDASLLVQAVRLQGDLRMPPTGALPQQEVDDLVSWIATGAFWPEEADSSPEPYVISAEHRAHWAFQPLSIHPAPDPEGAGGSTNAVDRFLLARLAEEGLEPVPLADRRTLIRRVTYDLTGLPPTPEDVHAFVADSSAEAYSELVERLLASPRYGERWGRHWLDLVRYADTAGDSGDFPVPEAFKYRNYVIDSFQEDKPYDQFVREQIAGDLLESADEDERWERIVATGYLAISRRIGVSPHRLRHITLEDTIDNLGKTFLGLSVQCARCHDHKFDPIPTADYYALYGILDSSSFPHPGAEHLPHRSNFVYRVGEQEARRLMADYEERIRFWNDLERAKFREYQSFQNMLITTPGRSREIVWEELQHLRAERAHLARTEPPLETAYAVRDGEPKDSAIHRAGDPKTPGPKIRRGFLQILGGAKVPRGYQGSGAPAARELDCERRQSADRARDGQSRLAPPFRHRTGEDHQRFRRARVSADASRSAGLPSALFHRQRVVSQGIASSDPALGGVSARERRQCGELRDRSPEPPPLARQSPSIGCGADPRLDPVFQRRIGSSSRRSTSIPAPPHVFLPPARAVLGVLSDGPAVGLHHAARIQKHPYLDLFDGPDGNLPVSERKSTTTTLQALYLMNSEFMHAQSQTMAERWSAQLRIGTASCNGRRRPFSDGRARTTRQSKRRATSRGETGSEEQKRAGFLRAMLASNEFLLVD